MNQALELAAKDLSRALKVAARGAGRLAEDPELRALGRGLAKGYEARARQLDSLLRATGLLVPDPDEDRLTFEAALEKTAALIGAGEALPLSHRLSEAEAVLTSAARAAAHAEAGDLRTLCTAIRDEAEAAIRHLDAQLGAEAGDRA